MRKIFLILNFLILLICPIMLNASTYSEAKSGSGNYLNGTDYKNHYSRYLTTPTNSDSFYKAHENDISDFRLGGLLSLEEFNTTLIKNPGKINYSYLFESRAFWTLTSNSSDYRKVVDYGFPNVNIDSTSEQTKDIGYKVTEYTMPEVGVSGLGTYENPWIFAPQYRVFIRVNDINKGVLKNSSGNDVSELELIVHSYDRPKDIYIESKGEYQYIGSTCGPILNGMDANREENPRLVLSNVTRDVECIVNFGERPIRVYLDQTDNVTKKSNPKEMYLLRESGWYSDSFANVLINSLFEVPFKLGYTYKGYYKSSLANACSGTKIIDSSGKITTEKSITDNINDGDRLYPCHTANTYIVRYDCNTGSGDMDDVMHTYGVSKNLSLNACSKVGYSFAKWNTSADGTGTDYINQQEVSDLSAIQDDVVKLYARWSAHSYRISYDLNGGDSLGTSHPETATYDVSFMVDDPSRVGYDFAGWSVSEGLNTSTAKYGSSSSSVITGISSATSIIDEKYFMNLTPNNGVVVTLKANWTPKNDTKYVVNHYKQIINKDDDYNTTNYEFFESGQFTGTSDIEVTAELKSYTGYTAPSAQSVNINADGSRVVNYYYKRTHYTVTIKANNSEFGTLSKPSVSLDYANTYSVRNNTVSFTDGNSSTANIIEKDGYTTTFNNWSSAGGNITNNITLTANFSRRAHTYTILYDCNGGTGSTEKSEHTYGVKQNLTPNACSKTNYTFMGWLYNGETYADGASVENITKTDKGTVKFYAIWKDTVAPTCSLKADASGVTFASKDDNIAVGQFGLAKSTSETYNSTTSLGLSNGTFYGYVKDGAGNTGKCSITIGGTYVSNYSKTTKTCNRSLSNYTKITKTCNRTLYYTKTSKTCNKSTTYAATRKTCSSSVSYTRNKYRCTRSIDGYTGICTCGYYDNTFLVPVGKDCTASTCAATCGVAYSFVSGTCTPKYKYYFTSDGSSTVSSCSEATPSCSSDSHVGGYKITCTKNTTYSWTNVGTEYGLSSCSARSFTCGSAYVGQQHVSCTSSSSYSWGGSSSSTVTSCANNSISCGSSTVGQTHVSCSSWYSYWWGGSSTTTSSSCSSNTFDCVSGNQGSTYTSCSPNYNYSWGENTSSSTSCSVGSSFSCGSGTHGSSYVSDCTPTAYACSSGYTKINDSWCYKY